MFSIVVYNKIFIVDGLAAQVVNPRGVLCLLMNFVKLLMILQVLSYT